MSDTPRTDALLETILDRAGQVGPRNCPEEWVTLCRKVEHELSDAHRAIESLRASVRELVGLLDGSAAKNALQRAKDLLP